MPSPASAQAPIDFDPTSEGAEACGSAPRTLDGQLHPAFSSVARRLRAQLAEDGGGVALCVYHQGRPVVDIWGGEREEDVAWARDTLCPSFSTTKGVTSTLAHICVDQGLLDYDDRVALHWPEFAQNGKERITVRHVMTHQAGLWSIRDMVDDAHQMTDWRHMVRAIERAEPLHGPGERTGYHGLTYGFILGEILQRATGRRFSTLVRDLIAKPLGVGDGMFVGAPKRIMPRIAKLHYPNQEWLRRLVPHPAARFAMNAYRPGIELGARMAGIQLDLRSLADALAPEGIERFDFDAHETLGSPIPAANGVFTARALARMYAAIGAGGELDGARLFSRRTFQRLRREQAHSGRISVMPVNMRWRLGYHGVYTWQGIPRNAFGHFGFGGSGAWCDPSRELAVAMTLNSGLGTPFGDSRIARISAAVLRCADRVAPRGSRRGAGARAASA